MIIDSESMLLVMIMPDGRVNTKHLSTGTALDANDAQIIKNALNAHLSGRSLDDVSLSDIMSIEEEFGDMKALVNPILRIAYEAAVGSERRSVEVDGITNLLSYPEFKNVEKVKDLLGLFEQNGDTIKDFLPVESDESGLKVYIGDEENSKLSDTSIVFCSLPVGNRNTIFGILGPKRMDYKKATNALKRLSQTLQSLAKDEDAPRAIAENSGFSDEKDGKTD
jgi:heat-inducible transcriptional repressor